MTAMRGRWTRTRSTKRCRTRCSPTSTSGWCSTTASSNWSRGWRPRGKAPRPIPGGSICAPNVKWQDGTPFTADDVVFSYQRIRGKNSAKRSQVATVKEAKKIDDLTVDFVTNGADPILPNELTEMDIMSKKWCEAHDVGRKRRARQGRELRAEPCDGHRPVPARLARARPQDRARTQPELVGQARRAMSTTPSSTSSPTPRPAWPPSCRARWT